jgi:voltage-gated potassium channel Kch
MASNPIAARLRYAFDNMMSRGPVAMLGWLALAVAFLVVIVTAVVHLGGFAPRLSFMEVLWMSLLRTLDGGTMGADQGGWPFLLSMLLVTFGGIVVVSGLVGVVTSAIEVKLGDLREGRSKVVEEGHTVILGWSPQVFAIASELVIANANQRRSSIVILGDRDKTEMEREIRERVPQTGNTHIVCRRGRPIDAFDLEITSLQTARSIIILGPEGDNPDSEVIKAILAITNNPQRRLEPYHIVAEIRDPRNMSVARLVGEYEVELVLMSDLVARSIAQTCRQSGLSVVHTELLDFAGDEIYFQLEPELVGETFDHALLAYEDSAVIGLCPLRGAPRLNPPMDTLIQEGDRIIAISEDDDTVRLSGLVDLKIRPEAIRLEPTSEPKPERTLMLGWNRRAPLVINELDSYVSPGSVVDVVADYGQGQAEIERCCPDLANETVTFQLGDTTDRGLLENLPLGSYDHVIVIACCDAHGPQEADARTLMTLLHLRDLAERFGYRFSVVSEMLDIQNRNLAEVTRADDYIVSPRLASLMLAQVSENKALAAVFFELFDPQGSEIYLKPAGDYVALGEPVNFYTVAQAGILRQEVAIGYRRARLANDAAAGYGVVINPDKADLVTFSEGDRIVVLAEG